MTIFDFKDHLESDFEFHFFFRLSSRLLSVDGVNSGIISGMEMAMDTVSCMF